MSTTNDTFFDQIISAKAALDAQPRLEAEIASYKAELTAASSAIQSLNLELDSRATVTNDLQKRIAELEAGLNESRKSEADTSARLSLLVDTLRDLSGNIGVALNVVEPPKPEPVTVVAEVVSVPMDLTSAPSVTDTTASVTSDWRVERDAVITTAIWPTINPEAHPANSDEARLRSEGKGWFDTDNHYHLATGIAKEAAEESNSPFATTTASPSTPATSTAQTSSAVPHAELLDGASLRDILHHAYTRS